MTEGYPPTMTVVEAGQLLGLSRSSAYRAASRGELPTVRFGRRLVVPTRKVLALISLDDEALLPTRVNRPIGRPDGSAKKDTA